MGPENITVSLNVLKNFLLNLDADIRQAYSGFHMLSILQNDYIHAISHLTEFGPSKSQFP